MAQFQQLPGYQFRPPSFTPLPVGSYFNREVPKLEVADINRAIAPIAEGVSQAILQRPRYQAQQQSNADAKRNAELQETLRQRMDDPLYSESITAGPGGLTHDPSRPLSILSAREAMLQRRQSSEALQNYRQASLDLQREKLLRSGAASASPWSQRVGVPGYVEEGLITRPEDVESMMIPSSADAMIDMRNLPVEAGPFRDSYDLTGLGESPDIQVEGESPVFSLGGYSPEVPEFETADLADIEVNPYLPSLASSSPSLAPSQEAVIDSSGQQVPTLSNPPEESKENQPFVIPTGEEKRRLVLTEYQQRRPDSVTPQGTPIFLDEAGQPFMRDGIEYEKDGTPVELRVYPTTRADRQGNIQYTRYPLLQTQKLPESIKKQLTERGISWDDYTTPKEAMAAISSSPETASGEALKLNVSQQKKAQAALNAQAAVRDIEELSSKFDRTSLMAAAAAKVSGNELLRPAARLLAGDDALAYQDAMSRWVEQVLRDMSGAAIKDSEYEQYYRMYFPTAGDRPEDVERKKRAREMATRAIMMGMSLDTANTLTRELEKQPSLTIDELISSRQEYAVGEEAIPETEQKAWRVLDAYKTDPGTNELNARLAELQSRIASGPGTPEQKVKLFKQERQKIRDAFSSKSSPQ